MTTPRPCWAIPQGLRDDRILSLLRDLVRINTEHAAPAPGAPYGEGCELALRRALLECESRGMRTSRLGQKVGIAEVGEDGPLVAFPVHLDVVPAGDGWTRDPYGAQVEDGMLYGRGCMDNKIGAAVMIELVGELWERARAAAGLPCRIRIIFGTDEETGMSDLREYVESGCELPSLGFVPDAAFPVVRGEKARLHLVLTCDDADLPAGLSISGGTAANVVPDSARATLPDGTTVRASGKSAHGSTPERGQNAICKLLRELAGTPEVSGDVVCLLERLFCRDLTGAALGIDVPDAEFGHTSVNLGVLEAQGRRVRIELDVRFGSGISEDEVVSRLRGALGARWDVRVAMSKQLHLVPEDDPCVQALLAAYERVTGEPGTTSVMAGGTYASLLPALVAFGPKLPGTHTGAHGIDEHVLLENISKATDIYEAALEALVELSA